MKKIKYLATILLVTLIFSSCNEDEWLKEEAFDFYAPENSYETPEQFNSAVARLYESTNYNIMWSSNGGAYVYQYTSDIAYDAISPTHALNSYSDKVTPETKEVRVAWERYYRVIFDANVIIERIVNEDVNFSSETERKAIEAEAKFFRAFYYRNLGIQFGGVPLALEEFSEPKRDFTRASREEVWEQCISDLIFAKDNLPHVSELSTDGRVTKAAANHLLAELYIITGDYDKAIAAASSVIDDPSYSLMTERFGSRKNEDGDVYWDLFRRENQNRNGVNTESIWVAQYEYLVDGGGKGSDLPRFLVPMIWKLTGDSDGKNLFFGHSEQHGGRGIGWMAGSKYLLEDIWVDNPEDMRNSEYNIIRDIVSDNPESAYFGQGIVESGAIINYTANMYNRYWSAIIAKSTPINNFPIEVVDDPSTGATTKGAKYTFRDHYYMRLAETYLLRAEAYMGKGDNGKAADDINVVRTRANATLIGAAEVNIDFILDERARELNFEELRTLTLMRVGKLADRVSKNNPMYNGQYASHGVEEYHNLWPIPQSEIERNSEAVLEQNPGYN